MTADPNGWPDASNPGAPLNPEQDDWHWAVPTSSDFDPVIVRWTPEDGWGSEYAGLELKVRWSGWSYLGPCQTPAEVAAMIEAARREEREACAAEVDAMAHEVQDNINEDGDLHIENGKEIKPLPHALRWLKNAAAAIRARGEGGGA